MSKKNKVSSVKALKKNPVKKVAKKAKKSSATNSIVIKPVGKAAKENKSAPKTAKSISGHAFKSASKPPNSAHHSKTPTNSKKAIVKSPAKAIKTKAQKTQPKKAIVTKSIVKKAIVKKSAPTKAIKKPETKIVSKTQQPLDGKAHLNGNAHLNGKAHKPELAQKADAKKEKEIKINGNKTQATSYKPQLEEKSKKGEEIFTKKQIAEKKSHDVLAITNTIPVKAKNEISQSKIASISHSITNPIKRTDSYAIKPEKEPVGKFEMEFAVHASAEMLYEFLSSPSGLSEWFCDDLNIRNGIYTFIWEDQLQQARLLKTLEMQLVRFQWVDKTDGSFFEFKVQRDDLTNDIALIITDFAESNSERESSKLLWHSQVEKLMHVIGSIF